MENNPLANRIEAYFSALEAPLSELPAPRREEFLREARAHVQSMVEARRADGMDELAAWDSALANFGDPQEVGRALWREWAASGQLESEGAPLSKWDLVRGCLNFLLWPLGVTFLTCVAATVIRSERAFVLLLSTALFGVLVWILTICRRAGLRWTRHAVLLATINALLILCFGAYIFGGQSWRATSVGYWAGQFPTVAFFGISAWQLLNYKRDLPKRPWRFAPYAARYKESPVAAEQEYRFFHLARFALVSLSFCGLILSLALQSSHPVTVLLIGAAVLAVGCGLALWLKK